MHTEVCLRFRSDVSLARLTAGMGLSPASMRLLRAMPMPFDGQRLPAGALLGMETRFVYLVLRESPHTLRLIVVPRTPLAAATPLVRKTQEIIQRFLDSAEANRLRRRTIALDLHAEDALVAVGRQRDFASHLRQRFVDTAFGDVMMGFLTFLLTGVLTDEWTQAAVVGVAAVAFFLAWLGVEAASARGEYEFDV